MALTFTLPFLTWCVYFLFQKKFEYKKIISLVLAGLLSLALAAFYILPVLFESKYVQLESMFRNYYHYSAHFTSVYQLFISRFWGDGASVWGQNDNMSFQIGYLHWILPLLIILYSFFYRPKKEKDKKILILSSLLALVGFFTAFMTHQRSIFIWQIFPIIQKIQFPWRFLNHSIFLFSLSIGVIPHLVFRLKIKEKYQKICLTTIIILVFAFNLNYFHPFKSGPLTDQQKFSGKAWTNQVTSGIHDYLPKTAGTAAKEPAQDYIDQITPSETRYTISGAKKGTDWLFFNLDLDRNSQITLPLLAFPNFQVKDNQQVIDYTIEPELGRIVLSLSAGQHQIYTKLRNTPIRTIANTISLLSWAYLVGFTLKHLCKKTKSKK